jgi:aldose 1-epimerase
MPKNLSVPAFQTNVRDKKTNLFYLENKHGVGAAITNYGARVVAIWMPDRNGNLDNIVAGYDSISDYLQHDEICLGATIGRYANRIKGASFSLAGKQYNLTANEGVNQLHGGFLGFHNQVWDAEQHKKDELRLTLFSQNGDEGYPGNIKIEVTYLLLDDDQLRIKYKGQSDADTILNVTNHTYFNLAGESSNRRARSTQLMINADYYLPIDKELIPTGDLEQVQDTPFDFKNKRTIEQQVEENHPQLKRGNGYDHNFVLNKRTDEEYTLAATAYDAKSGRKMEVKTTEPGMQLYECEFDEQLDLNMGSAFCLETQHYPDSPHNAHFPSTMLKAGEQFYSKTAYIFSVEE